MTDHVYKPLPLPHYDGAATAMVDRVMEAISDAGVDREFFLSRECDHMVLNIMKLLNFAYADGYKAAMDETTVRLKALTGDIS